MLVGDSATGAGSGVDEEEVDVEQRRDEVVQRAPQQQALKVRVKVKVRLGLRSYSERHSSRHLSSLPVPAST